MEAPQGGFFLQTQKKPFDKPPLTLDALIDLLKSRGLTIHDEEQAQHYLRFIGYYRLSGYARFFAAPDDVRRERFRPGTTFDQILDLYIFDRKLRVVLMDALERIEIAFKAAVCQEGCMHGGSFWLTEPSNFDAGAHPKILDEIREAISKENGKAQQLFISHFYRNYSDDWPASWMIMETLSFGATSRVYKRTNGSIQVAVASHFGIHRTVLESWTHALAFCRNVCAHNCRVWNRTFTIKPKLPKHSIGSWPASGHDRLYTLCCIIQYMMKVISDGSDWKGRLHKLLSERGLLPLQSMGFPSDWETAEFWNFPQP